MGYGRRVFGVSRCFWKGKANLFEYVGDLVMWLRFLFVCYCSRKAAYVSRLEHNLIAIQTELQKLIEAKNDVITRVANAEQQQLRRLNKVQGWLSRVEAVEAEVGELTRDSSQEIEKLCLGGYCSKNCKSSYKFGKKVSKKLQLVATLMDEGAFEVVAEKVPQPAVDEKPLQPTIVGLESTLDKVWRCLVEGQFGIIGLYGMGGVGKTTLLAQINNKFLHTPNYFDIVIWVVVSKDMQLERIQQKIGERIGWLRNRSFEEKASGIFNLLSKMKFLLLLDDIWERIDLAKMGVPFPASSRNASKIVFTTRLVDVCGLMEAQKTFKVECLADQDAWELFQKKVGEETLESRPNIPELAQTVAKECSGLPLALITTGRAMSSKKTPEESSYAIQMLRRSAYEFPGMEREVFRLLKFSYDSLSSDVLRSCLLYCSLFPEDYQIRKIELIECWIGEGFLKENEGINGVHNQGYYIIGVLVHACLLEEAGSDYVKLHDVIRDMTLGIACEVENENFLVSAGIELTEPPEVKKWEDKRRISLMRNKIVILPICPICPHLTTFFLGINMLDTIPSDFFDFMPSLKVLNLSKNRFLIQLPSGISNLVSLQYLNLSENFFKELPNELKALTNLKCLNLEYMRYLYMIPQQLLCNFSRLKVLRMLDCGSANTVPEDSVLFGGSEILVEELITLKHLNVLSVTLRSFYALRRLLSHQQYKSCKYALELRRCEDSRSWNILSISDLKYLDKLDFVYCTSLEELKVDYAEVQTTREPYGFNSLQSVTTIDCCSKLREMTWLVFAPNLKVVHIERCYGMEEIISVWKVVEVPGLKPFAKLQYLRLQVLRNLKKICLNALPFPNLLELFVSGCPNLKKLPLDYNSAKERKLVIRGEQHWWNELQWKDEATLNAFTPCFKSI